MINCILIQNNEINEVKVKNLTEDCIYKKCNFKNDTDFSKLKIWNYDNFSIELWGKNKGFSNSLSNFELFKNNGLNIYGKSIFLMKNDEDKYISLNKENFNDYFNIINDVKSKIIDDENNESKNKEDLESKEIKENEENCDENSEYSYNSELTYELYEYSDDETL
jgi:hypothetical protein|tara:strand:- start:369 stop:863 length:495 start_codon:yes stop_codon:yes gene_type:complete